MIPGDGIGPEVIDAAVRVLQGSRFDADYTWLRHLGFSRFKKDGISISEHEKDVLRRADAILKGPLETPKAAADGYRSLTLELRRQFGLYANVRPFRRDGIDTIIVRENTEDLYIGRERVTDEGAVAEREITRNGAFRIHSFAFDLAHEYGRKRVTCVHKSNVMPLTDGLFLNRFWEVAKRHQDLTTDEATVDSCAYRIQKNPGEFDVLVTPNMYGDILSSQLAGALGSLGLCGSMNVGENHALFEPIHGTARDIEGRGIANPIAAIAAAGMMARFLKEEGIAKKIENAVNQTLREKKVITPDIGGNATTGMVTEEIKSKVEASL